MKLIAIGFIIALSSFAQVPPPKTGFVDQLFYSGSNVQYDCQAPAQVAPTSVNVSGSTLVSIVVSSNTATVTTALLNGLWAGARVTVSGSTVGALNTTYTVLTVSSTTYTFTTSGVSDGTYNNTPLTVTTNSPLLTSAVWFITVIHYNGSVVDGTYPAGPGASISYKAICSQRASY